MIYVLFYILVYLLLQKEAKSPLPNMTIRRIIPLLFTLFVGLRGANVGQDTGVYYEHYYLFGQWGCSFVEPGFDWINRLCYHQGWESWTLLLICAALTIFPVYLMLNKLKRNEYTIVAMLFYCCTFSTLANGIRQSVVCGTFLYLMSFYFDKGSINKKDFAIYVGSILISSLIHTTALFLLPFLFLYKLPSNKNIYVLLFILSFLFLFIDISPYLPEISIGNRDYGRYVENIKIKQASGLGFLGTTVIKFLILYAMCKYDSFRKHRVLTHLVMFSFILANLGFNIPMIGRVTMYFTWFTYVMIAKLYVEESMVISTKLNSLNWYSMLLICYIILVVHGIFSPTNKLNPYTTYWQEHNYENYLWHD